MIRFASGSRALLCALTMMSGGCGKFQQARECGTFVKTVNAWLASSDAQNAADAGTSSDPKQVAAQARGTAEHYAELSRRLAGLHVQSEDLAPRVQRYEQIADSAAATLREVAEALEHGDLEKARQKRVDFDTVARREPPLVKEINGLCR
ncbi:MAG: hypothetical protein WDO69_32830 [Pseudomonadota bacterium]